MSWVAPESHESRPKSARRRARAVTSAASAAAAIASSILGLNLNNAHAEDVSSPATLQWFEGTWPTMGRRTADVFQAGYGSIWGPPPGRADSGNQSVGYDVYDRFDLGSAGNPTLYGTEAGIESMIRSVHGAGMNFIADNVSNHDGFEDQSTTGFAAAGGYPGFFLSYPGDPNGDFHAANATGDQNMRISGLIDIDQTKNYQAVRNPVPGFANNLPAGTVPLNGRLANVPSDNNRRFYPDRSLTPLVVSDGSQQNITIYPFNTASPLSGDPVAENDLDYLARYAQWMVQVVGVDGFRFDAAKNLDSSVLPRLDQVLYRASPRTQLDGTQEQVFSFSEVYDGNRDLQSSFIRKDINPATPNVVGGNRDVLDFPQFFALRDNLNQNGVQNDWRNVVSAGMDVYDDGKHNGSAGVLFVQSHDDFGPDFEDVAYAYTLMQPGNAIVYFNEQEFGTNRSFPKAGRDDALGGQDGDRITTLVDIRNTHGRGNWKQRYLSKELFAFERQNSALVLLNNRGDSGYDERTFATGFAPGTRLLELTGNAADPTLNPNGDIPQTLLVAADGTVTARFLRNKGADGTLNGDGYLIYGLAGPQGTLSLSNVSRQIAPDAQTASNNGTARLTAIDVVQASSMTATLHTTKAYLLGTYRDPNADGDNAQIKIDGGIDLNGDGHVDNVTPGSVSYGFEEFTTTHVPGLTSPDNNGVYAQNIDVSQLSEGYHYIEVRAFRHRDPATEGSSTPAIYSDFKDVIYVDRVRAPSSIVSFDPQTGSSGNTSRDIIVKSLDGTASDLVNASGTTVKAVHVFYDYGVNQRTVDQLVSDAYGGLHPAGDYDTGLTRFGISNTTSGNHAITIVMFEPDYNPALGYAGGGVSVTRFPGIFTQTTIGQGLSDLDFNGSLSTSDITTFASVLASNNTTFNPAGDLNADGLVDESDDVLELPWLAFKGASPATLTAATDLRLTRAVALDGTMNIPGGTLNVSGTNVPGVAVTFSDAFNIPVGRTITKTGSQNLTLNGPVSAGAGGVLAITGGTANLNTNGGTNLSLNVTGAGTRATLGATQTLKAVTIGAGAVVALTSVGTSLQFGGKVLKAGSLAVSGGQLELGNNNAIIDYTGATPLGDVVTQLGLGRNGGGWSGLAGITSSAAGSTGGLTALGAAEASDVLGLHGTATALWSGQTVDGTSLLIRYTYAGDANLDGKINIDDYTRIDNGIAAGISGWFNGDFNYDGKVNVDDYIIIDGNVASQGAVIANAASAGSAGWSNGITAIPEPGAASAMGTLAGWATMKRNQRTRPRGARSLMPRRLRKAFTLVELLVVIGIIAVLIGILLPTLNNARRAAQTMACLSNVRQLSTATMMFANEHHGYCQPCSDNGWVGNNDPLKRNFAYRDNGGADFLQDWASALLRYMGDRSLTDFQKAPPGKTRVFVCPSEPWMDASPQPGFRLYNNVTNSVSNYQMVSYGYNADIASLLDANGTGRFEPGGNYVSVYGGPKDRVKNGGQPLGAHLSKVARAAETLLYADCGTRPLTLTPNAALDDNEALYYTTNFLTTGGTLYEISLKVNLKDRIPYNRHRSRINVAFCDGHAETVGKDGFNRVRVSPYRF